MTAREIDSMIASTLGRCANAAIMPSTLKAADAPATTAAAAIAKSIARQNSARLKTRANPESNDATTGVSSITVAYIAKVSATKSGAINGIKATKVTMKPTKPNQKAKAAEAAESAATAT